MTWSPLNRTCWRSTKQTGLLALSNGRRPKTPTTVTPASTSTSIQRSTDGAWAPTPCERSARHLIRDDRHHRLVVDPAVDKVAAIRAYTKVGFRPGGVMRQYERGRDGTWHDGLLMDLLADELIG
jgi:aminoglycoside 6'-N-acetyltransferase